MPQIITPAMNTQTSNPYKMSLADTYLLASKARSKLTREASRQDHDLRILVSHANMLDNLMEELSKQRYNNQHKVEPVSSEYPHDSIEHEYEYEDEEEDDDDDDYYNSGSDDEYYEDEFADEEDDDDEYALFEDCQLPSVRVYQSRNSHKVLPTVDEVPYEEEQDEEELLRQETAQTKSQDTTTLPSISTTSVEVVEISEEDEDDEDSISSPSSDGVPSLCYSSEDESESEEIYPSTTLKEDQHKSHNKESPASKINTTTQIDPSNHSESYSKRLMLPTPEQLDLIVS